MQNIAQQVNKSTKCWALRKDLWIVYVAPKVKFYF